jgi:hypothetical protein
MIESAAFGPRLSFAAHRACTPFRKGFPMNLSSRAAFLASFALLAAPALSACTVHETRVVEPAPAPAAPAPQPAPAPPPPAQAGAHPAYLHALTDLRNARFNLERKGGDAQMKWDERDAVAAIDHAIEEIKRAAIDDGKDLNDHPAVDAREPRSGRLHRALAALRSAHDDVAREEDNGYAGGLKARAVHHIDEAIHHTEQGIAAAEHAS